MSDTRKLAAIALDAGIKGTALQKVEAEIALFDAHLKTAVGDNRQRILKMLKQLKTQRDDLRHLQRIVVKRGRS